MTTGIVYIARNDIHEPNIYKIGKTLRTDLNERMDELTSHTGVLGEFRYEGYVLVDDVDECERKLHEKFSHYRVQNNREFFRLSLREIIFEINNIIADKIIRNNLPQIPNDRDVALDYFLKFNNLMSFLRFYQNYGCRPTSFCSMCSSIPHSGLIIFLCQTSGHDLSSKEKRFHLFNKLKGLGNCRYRQEDESSINFSDLTSEHKMAIYGELCSQLSNLNNNEVNSITSKMLDFLKVIIDLKQYNENLKKIFDQKFKNFFIDLSKLSRFEINNFNPNKSSFIAYLLNDLENDNELKNIFHRSALLEKIREDHIKVVAAQKEYNLKIQQEIENRKLQKELRLKQKQDQHKIFLNKQKIKNEKRQIYITRLSGMNLVDRIKNIIQERPFGLDGIPKALFEIENISSAFLLLSENEKSKFKSLIENKKKKFFKIIKKKLI